MIKHLLMVSMLLTFGCVAKNYVVFPNTSHPIKIYDDILKDDAKLVINFISDNFEKLKRTEIASDTTFENLQSISRWHTPGIPTKDDLKCRYSVNFSMGIAGNDVCVGETVNEGAKHHEILGVTSWIK